MRRTAVLVLALVLTGCGASSSSSGDPATLGDELFALLHVLDREHVLRRAVSDPAQPADRRAAVLSAVLDGKIAAGTLDFAAELVRLRWARSIDLTDAIEELAVIAEAASAEAARRLDDLEDEVPVRPDRRGRAAAAGGAGRPARPGRPQGRAAGRATGGQGHPGDAAPRDGGRDTPAGT